MNIDSYHFFHFVLLSLSISSSLVFVFILISLSFEENITLIKIYLLFLVGYNNTKSNKINPGRLQKDMIFYKNYYEQLCIKCVRERKQYLYG